MVGATGQLGTATVRKLQAAGRPVRAFVRPMSNYQHLQSDGVELAFGDLRDPASVQLACSGAASVIATAAATFPRGRYDFEKDEIEGYRNLLEASRLAGARQVVVVSINAPYTEPYLTYAPTLRCKLAIERAVEQGGVPYTIFRAGPFMDDYLALIGSEIPLRGAEGATLLRPFWLSRMLVTRLATAMERWGLAVVPGPSHARHAFIALHDVAEYLVRALDDPRALNHSFHIGGPENVSWADVTRVYSELLGRPVRIVRMPRWLVAQGAKRLRRLSPAAANHCGLLMVMNDYENVLSDSEAARAFDLELQGVEDFLHAKAELERAL